MIEVIGTDAGTPTSLPADHRDRLLQAGLVAAPQRLHGPLRELFGAALPPLLATDRIEACLETLQGCRPEQAVVVLASGDPLWFGIGRLLLQHIPREQLRFHPAPSSLQLAFARVGRPWQDASWVSLHGRDPEPLAEALQKRPPALAVLTDPARGGAAEIGRAHV